MNTRVIVDASVWISRLMPQEVHHDTSRLWIEQFVAEGGTLIAPTFLLVEVAAGVSRKTGQAALSKEALKELSRVGSMLFVPVDLSLIQTAVDMATDLHLRAGDAIYLAVAHQLGLPLVSWDKEQLQRGSSIITTYTPANYVF